SPDQAWAARTQGLQILGRAQSATDFGSMKVLRVDPEDKKVYVDRTKEQIKSAPEFHRDKHLGDGGYHEELGTYYGTGAPFGGRPA
ncbi:PRC-barrel domain containing protein, partial [Streptomyces sp. NPDC058289]